MSISSNSTEQLFPSTPYGDVNSQSAYVNSQSASYSQGPLDPILFSQLLTQPTFNTSAVIPFLNAATNQFPMEPGENWNKYCARMTHQDPQMADSLKKTCVEYAKIELEHITKLKKSKSSLLKELEYSNPITQYDLNEIKSLNKLGIDALQKLIAVKPLLVGFDLNVNSFFQFISHDSDNTTSIDKTINATKPENYASQFNLLILKSCVAKLTDDDKILLRNVANNLKFKDFEIDQFLKGSTGAENFVSILVIQTFVQTNISAQQIIDCYEKFLESRTRENFLHLVSIYVTIESYGSKKEQKMLVKKLQIRDLIIKTIDLDLEVHSILQQEQPIVNELFINFPGLHFYSVEDVEIFYQCRQKLITPKKMLTCSAVFKFSSDKNVEELTFESELQRSKRLKELDDLLFSSDSIESPTIRKERNRITSAPILDKGVSQEDKQSRMSVWDTYLKNLVPSSVEYVSNFLYNSTNLKMTFLAPNPIGEAASEKQEALIIPKLAEMRDNSKKIPRMISVFSQMLSFLKFSDKRTSENIRGAIESIHTDFQLFGKNVEDMKDQTKEEFTDSMIKIDGLKYFYVQPLVWGENLVLNLLRNDYNIPIEKFISFNTQRETVKAKYLDKTITYPQAFQLINLIETVELQQMLWSNEETFALSYDGIDRVQHFTRLWYKSFIIFIDAESSLMDLAQAQKDYYIAEKYFETKENTEDTKQIKHLFDKLLGGTTISKNDQLSVLMTYRRLLVKAPISEERDTQLGKSFFQIPQKNFVSETEQLQDIIVSRISLPIQRIRASYFYILLVEETISNGNDLINVPADYQTNITRYTKLLYRNAKYELKQIQDPNELLIFQSSVFKIGKKGSEPIMISLSLLFHEKYSIFPEERKDSYLKEFQSNLDICNTQFPDSKDTDILKSISFYLTQLGDTSITQEYLAKYPTPSQCLDSIFELFKNPFYVSKDHIIDEHQAIILLKTNTTNMPFQDELSMATFTFDNTRDISFKRLKLFDKFTDKFEGRLHLAYEKYLLAYEKYLTTSIFKSNTMHYVNLYFYEPLRNNKEVYFVLLRELNKYALGVSFNELIDGEQQAATYLCNKDPACVSRDLLFALNYKLRQEYVTSELNPYYIIHPKLVQIEHYTNSTPSTSGTDNKNNDINTDDELPEVNQQDESTREPIPLRADVAFFNNRTYYFNRNQDAYDPNSGPSSSTILQKNANILKLLNEAMDISNPIQKNKYVYGLWAKYKTHDFVRNILPMIRDREEFSLLHNDIVSSTIQRLEFNFREWLIMSYSLKSEIGYLNVLLDENLRREDFTKNDELGKFIFDTTFGCLFQLRYLELPEEDRQKNSKKNIRIPRLSLILKQVLDNSPTLKGTYNTQDFESKSILNYLRHVFQGQLKKSFFSMDDFTNECFSVTSLNNFFLEPSKPEKVFSVSSTSGVDTDISNMLSKLINNNFYSGVYSVNDHYSAKQIQDLIEIPITINFDMKSMLSQNTTELDSYEKKLNFKSQLNDDLLALVLNVEPSTKTTHMKNENHIEHERNKIKLAKSILVLKDAIETQQVFIVNLPVIFETIHTSLIQMTKSKHGGARMQLDFVGLLTNYIENETTGLIGATTNTGFKISLMNLMGEIENLGSGVVPNYNFPDILPESDFVKATEQLTTLMELKDKYESTTASLDALFIKLQKNTNIFITRPSKLPSYFTRLYETITKLSEQLGLIDQLHLQNEQSIGPLISEIKKHYKETINKNEVFFVSIDDKFLKIKTARDNQPVNAKANQQFDKDLMTLDAEVIRDKQVLQNTLGYLSLTTSVTPEIEIFSDMYNDQSKNGSLALNLFNLKTQQSVVLILFTNFNGTKSENIIKYQTEIEYRMNTKINSFETEIQTLDNDIQKEVGKSNEPIKAITILMRDFPVRLMENNVTVVKNVKKQFDDNIILIDGYQKIIDVRASSIVKVNGTAPIDKKFITLKSATMETYSSEISTKLIEIEKFVDEVNFESTKSSNTTAYTFLTNLREAFNEKVTSETPKVKVKTITEKFTTLLEEFETCKDLELKFYNEMSSTTSKRQLPDYAEMTTKLNTLFNEIIPKADVFNGKVDNAIAATALYSQANDYTDPTSRNYIESKTLKGISSLIQSLTGVQASILKTTTGYGGSDKYTKLVTTIADLQSKQQEFNANIKVIKTNATMLKTTIDSFVKEIKDSDLFEDKMEPALKRIAEETDNYVELLTQFSTISGEEMYDKTLLVKDMISDALLVGPDVELLFNTKKQNNETTITASKETEISTFYDGVLMSIKTKVVSETELNGFFEKAQEYKTSLNEQYKIEINVYTKTNETLVKQVTDKHSVFKNNFTPKMSMVDDNMKTLSTFEGERNTKIDNFNSYVKDNIEPLLQLGFINDLKLAEEHWAEATTQQDAILLLNSKVIKTPEKQSEENKKLDILSDQLSILFLCIDSQNLVNVEVTGVIVLLNEFDKIEETQSIKKINDLLRITTLSESFPDSYPEFKNIQTRVQGLRTKRDGLVLEKSQIEGTLTTLKVTIETSQSEFASAKNEEKLDVMNTKITTIGDDINKYDKELVKLSKVTGVLEESVFLAAAKNESTLNSAYVQAFTNAKNDDSSLSARFTAAQKTATEENEVITFINEIGMCINNGTITEQQIENFQAKSKESSLLLTRYGELVNAEKSIISARKLTSEESTEPAIQGVESKYMVFTTKVETLSTGVLAKIEALVMSDGQILKETNEFNTFVEKRIVPLLREDISIDNIVF